jgi:hypothetical protein
MCYYILCSYTYICLALSSIWFLVWLFRQNSFDSRSDSETQTQFWFGFYWPKPAILAPQTGYSRKIGCVLDLCSRWAINNVHQNCCYESLLSFKASLISFWWLPSRFWCVCDLHQLMQSFTSNWDFCMILI